MQNKRGQLTIIIIIALVLVAGTIIFFASTKQKTSAGIPTELKPVYDAYLSCIKEDAKKAANLAGSQAGFVYPKAYESGSEYYPFSSQLDFLGFPVQYWYYLAGNGVIKESVPTKTSIEEGIAKYVEDNIDRCNFDTFYQQGFSVNVSKVKVKARLSDSSLSLSVESDFIASKDSTVGRKSSHQVEVSTKLGKMFALALEIYNKEKTESFLENYSADILYSYAPVDGVEISCAPKIWKTREVVNTIKSALEANIGSIKLEGNYYNLKNKENQYFVVNQKTDEAVSFLYSSQWPSAFEVAGADDELMIAKPIGLQEGLGILGFCYSPYHFVYDLRFPVMVQIYDESELFQFPVSVIIDKNLPRKGVFSEVQEQNDFNVCQYKNQQIEVNTYNISLTKIEANLSYSCFDQTCELGQTSSGTFSGFAPACVNGQLIAKSAGYSEKKTALSTNSESLADIILDKEYTLSVEVKVDGKSLPGTAILTFEGEKTITTSLPEINNISLTEGNYNVTLYVYGNSSITIPASTKTQCFESPVSGILGIIGQTKEQCIPISLPETSIGFALLGGGSTQVYLLPSDMEKGHITINSQSLPVPNSLENLQNNYDIFDTKRISMEFK